MIIHLLEPNPTDVVWHIKIDKLLLYFNRKALCTTPIFPMSKVDVRVALHNL